MRKAKKPATPSKPNEWQLQDAKARFSELFQQARDKGPQRVTRHRKTAVVVLPAEDYERLVSAKARRGSLVEFFARSPLANLGLDFKRQPDYGRSIDL
jgi:antitoxin Phd